MTDYHLLNTNKAHLPDDIDGTAIYENQIAATFGSIAEHGRKLEDIEVGDVVISYVSKVGYRAVGQVTKAWNGEPITDEEAWIDPDDKGEYHISVDWERVLPPEDAIDWREGNKLLGYSEGTPVNYTVKHVGSSEAGKNLANRIRGKREPEPDLYLVPTGRDSENLRLTVREKVSKDTIREYDPQVDLAQFEGDRVPIWGHESEQNVTERDILLLHRRGTYHFSARVGAIEENPALAEEIWESDEETFTQIYYLTDLTEISIPDEEIAAVLDYNLDYAHPQQFTKPEAERMARLRRKFGSVLDFLEYLDQSDVSPEYERIAMQLEETRQVIFHGPPGTGKTYHAKRFADWWIHQYPGSVQENEQFRFVTFHPSFTYEDFIEGLTAKSKDGQISYELDEGVFKEYVKSVRYWPNHEHVNRNSFDHEPRYVFLIDEINRGNVANILGETVTLLEADKRADEENAMSVRLAHSNKEFEIPSNVYIIGTMNTADRSIALVDAAIRRRFGFVPFPPSYETLCDAYELDEEDLADKAAEETFDGLVAASILTLKDINQTIRNRKDLGKGKQIGHSYLLERESEQDLINAWKFEILPLLEEYLFGSFDEILSSLLTADHAYYLIDPDEQRVKTLFGETGTEISEEDALKTVLKEQAGIVL